MAEDIELLRLRAKAKLKLRQMQSQSAQGAPQLQQRADPVYSIPGIPGIGGENVKPVRFDDPGQMHVYAPDPVSSQNPMDRIFPSQAHARQNTKMIGAGEGKIEAIQSAGPLDFVSDVMSYPARRAGELSGRSEITDPAGSILKPEINQYSQWYDDKITEAQNSQLNEPIKWAVIRGLQAAKLAATVPLQAASDPLLLVSPSAVAKAPGQVMGLMAKGAGAAERGSLAMAQELTDIPKEALSMAASKEGRSQLQALYGKEFEVGNKALEAAKAARYDMPESRLVDQAFQEKNVTIPAKEIEKVADAGNVMPKDPMAGMSPTEQQAQDALEGWRNYMRGGEKPRDFAREADAALEKSKAAGMDALMSEQSSRITSKTASAAERKAEGAKRKAAKAAGNAAASRMKFLKAADDADKNLLRFGKVRNEAGAEAESWLDEAKAASVKARQEGIDARAKLAAGKISQADYDMAKAEAIFTQHEAMVAEIAKRLDKGASIEDVGNQLARGLGMGADDIADVVSAARNRVRSNAPSIKDAPAENFRRRRMNLDFEINHDKEFKDVGDKAIAAMRKASKEALEKAAKDAGIEGYPEWMASMQKKLRTLDEFDRLAGNTKMAKEARVESLIRNALGGTNPEYKRQLFKDLEALGVVDFGELKTMALSRKLGPEGVAPWLPPQHNGSFMKALAYLKAVGGVGIGSPKVYTRVTLPTIRKAEEALSSAANGLTPRGRAAIEALKKTDDAQKKTRLLLIIENEARQEASNRQGEKK